MTTMTAPAAPFAASAAKSRSIAEILRRTDLDWDYVLNEAHDLGLKRMLADWESVI